MLLLRFAVRQDGFFIDIAKDINPATGYWMLVSAVIAMYNGFNARIAGTSRAVQVGKPSEVLCN